MDDRFKFGNTYVIKTWDAVRCTTLRVQFLTGLDDHPALYMFCVDICRSCSCPILRMTLILPEGKFEKGFVHTAHEIQWTSIIRSA